MLFLLLFVFLFVCLLYLILVFDGVFVVFMVSWLMFGWGVYVCVDIDCLVVGGCGVVVVGVLFMVCCLCCFVLYG